MNNQITLKNVSFAFSSQASLFFKDINFTLNPSMIYFLQGANGSGKSTLFRLLQGNVHSSEMLQGTICIDGKEHAIHTDQTRTLLHDRVHAVQQDYNSMIADNFSFEENLRFVHMHHIPTLTALPAYTPIPALVKRFNIDIHASVHLLSGGQRQILAILMALQQQPNILLLDEPTAALDPVNTAMVLKFLHELVTTTGITIVIISHDQTTINAYPHAGLLAVTIDAQTGTRTVEKAPALHTINLTQ